MRAVKSAAFVLVATMVVVAGWAVYWAGWRLWTSPRAPSASPQSTEPPVVEFRELRSGPAGQAGSLLTIDRGGQATLQTLPVGPQSTTKRTQLTCDELAWLPQQMKLELAELQSNYGAERAANEGELSVVYRWEGLERRVVWRNPESSPKPPEGYWAGLVAPLEDIRRRAGERADSWPLDDAIIIYNQTSSGIVGTYSTLLTIDKSGRAIQRHGLGIGLTDVREAQLTPQELASLLRMFEEAKFTDFQHCYGKHTPANEQNAYLSYHGQRSGNFVTWMNAGSDPKPPDGWFRIVEILDQIWSSRDVSLALTNATHYALSVELTKGTTLVHFQIRPGQSETRSFAPGAYQVQGAISRPNTRAFSTQWTFQDGGRYSATFSRNSQGDTEAVLAPGSGVALPQVQQIHR